MNQSINQPSYTHTCRFCGNLITSEPISLHTMTSILECYECGKIPEIHCVYYKFRLESPPALYQIDIYLTSSISSYGYKISNLMIKYSPPRSLKNAETPSDASLTLSERVNNPNLTNPAYDSYSWAPIANLPVTLINKPLINIVEKINSLKVFF